MLAVDAPSLYYRAFYGAPDSLTAPDGTPVNAVRGFIDALSTLINARRPDRLVCALDFDWRPAWRVELLPSYKAHRVADVSTGEEETPDLLSPQVPILLDVLEAYGIPAVGVDGFEADDLLGTLATRAPAPVEVVTGDRDLYQLINDDVSVVYLGRGISSYELMDDKAVGERYGIPASKYADFAVLRGDPSDGLPGVAGVGEKTAARLINTYGDIPSVLAAAGEQTPSLRTKLLAAADYLAVAPQVVNVARDVLVPPHDPTIPALPAHPRKLAALVEKWSLSGPVRRLSETLAANA